MRVIHAVLSALIFLVPLCADEKAIPRTIVTLYNHAEEEDVRLTKVHRFAEMPLNHLGLRVEYFDYKEDLPEIAGRDDVLGVLIWFGDNTFVPKPVEYLQWLINLIDQGKKVVLINKIGIKEKDEADRRIDPLLRTLWNKLGLKSNNEWTNEIFNISYPYIDKKVVNFERDVNNLRNPVLIIEKLSDTVSAHLIWKEDGPKGKESILIATGTTGGYIAEGYAIYSKYDLITKEMTYFWYVNPFEFFRLAFKTDQIPKLDTTTLAGRRIYFSHIDGDGWNNVTELPGLRENYIPSIAVLREEIFEKYPDLPVSVGPIGADIDKDWFATEKGLIELKKIFKLPHIEPAVHTFTHPFYWGFFENYDKDPKIYFDFEKLYDSSNQVRINQELLRLHGEGFFSQAKTKEIEKLKKSYDVFRPFYLKPFTTDLEVRGAIQKAGEFLPSGRKIALYLWSGDTRPYEEAIKMTREMGVYNLNGGDSRFDQHFPSYVYVSPLSRQVGSQRQIYAASSNENTYTNLWTRKFYGFRELVQTFHNTNQPIRLKPINLYYHAYSGEKMASLDALKENLSYIKEQEITPIKASHFAAIVEGFFTATILDKGEGVYAIENRGELQTVRFDRAALYGVDFSLSKGVIGQNVFQGSLYVYLDAFEPHPVIALKKEHVMNSSNAITHPHLVDSRWPVWKVTNEQNRWSFTSGGYGEGFFRWKVPHDGSYTVTFSPPGKEKRSVTFQAVNGELVIKEIGSSIDPVDIEVTRG